MRFEPDLRATPIGGGGMGVWCGETGVFIGPGIPLVERQSDEFGSERFVPKPAEHLGKVLSRGYGKLIDVAPLIPGLMRIAAALEKSDLALANIALAHLRIPPFQSLAHGILAAADALLKASPGRPAASRLAQGLS